MRVKSKKKLALLVSMALTVGSTLAVNPMDVYAATSVAWDADNNQYKVTVGDSEESFTEASDAITKIIAGLGTEADKDITIDLSDTTWQNNEASQNAAKNLAAALRDKQITLKSGADVKLTFSNGDAYTFVNGDEDSEVTLTKTDSVLKVDGNITTVTAKIDGNRPAKIDVAEGKTVGTITVNDGTDGTLALTGNGTVSKLEANGNITVSATDTTLTEIKVAESKTLTTAGDIKAGSITGNGTVTAGGALNVAGDIKAASVTATALTANNIETTGKITADKVTAGTVKAGSVDADVKANSLELNSVVKVDGSKTWDVGTLKTGGNLTVSDASKLTAGSIVSAGDLEISDTVNKVEAKNITSTGKMTIADAGNVAEGANITTEGGLTVTAGDLKAGSLSVNGELDAGENTITADSVAFGSGATITSTKANIKADAVTIDTASMNANEIKKLAIAPKTDGGTVNVKVVTSKGALPDETITNAINEAAKDSGAKVNITATSADAQNAQSKADDAIAAADEALKNAIPLAAVDVDAIAKANPFTTKLPSASDIAAVASPTKDQLNDLTTAKDGLDAAITELDKQIEEAGKANNEPLQKDLETKKAELEDKKAGLSTAGMQAKAAELTAAVQQAGKTAAAPGVASARTATVVTNVMTANVTGRTSELRGFASAVDEGRPAPDNVWFQYKHTDMDVDNGDVYGKSTVKTNNYQLGYDAKVGPNDYLGAYIGTTTGNVEFNAPAVTDRTDIDNAYDFGIYGTHMLPSDQYIDYMIHTGKFDSKYNGVTWGTKDTGAMIGYGAKIAQNDRLTWNPYIQLAYDKVSVDSYMAGANYIASDDSNNWTAKLGINLLDVSGFYGGLAYSRGLSGSYNAYINGVPMPSQDNNANVLYMSLGYRANMSRNVFLDLSMEKTFADYNGWTAAGKVNFYF